MPNLFLPVYFNIEKELLQLSEHIFFDDKQLSVYSIKIADLLIRTVIEIEAISKKLYFDTLMCGNYQTIYLTVFACDSPQLH